MSELLTPKFLPKDLVDRAAEMVLNGIILNDRLMSTTLKRHMGHIVVLVPAGEDARPDYPEWPNYHPQPFPILQKDFGNRDDWPHDFESIAMCKAMQLWWGRNVDGNTDSMPWLLFPDDTPFWGGVERHGMVVTCSGVQPWFDQMIAGMIADACKAFGYNYWMTSEDKEKGVDFLS